MTGSELLDELVAQVEREPDLTSIAALQARAYVLTDRREELAALLLRLATADAHGNHAHHTQMEAHEVTKVLDGYRRTRLGDDRLRELWAIARYGIREGLELHRVQVNEAINLIIGDTIEAREAVAS